MIFNGRNKVTSCYKLPARPGHAGIDLVGMDDKTIYAPVDGTVLQSRIVDKSTGNLTWQWGNYVMLQDSAGRRHIFAHMEKRLVQANEKVKAGQPLGIMGWTGYVIPAGPGGTHTHYEVRATSASGSQIDPTPFAGVPNAVGIYTGTPAGGAATPASAAATAETPKAAPEAAKETAAEAKPGSASALKVEVLDVFGKAAGKNTQAFNSPDVNDVAQHEGADIRVEDGKYLVTGRGPTAGGYDWCTILWAERELYMPTGGGVTDRCELRQDDAATVYKRFFKKG